MEQRKNKFCTKGEGVLLAFEAVSGLKVNLAKSRLFSINADHYIEELADVMGCKVENLPTVYLGLPLGAKKNEQWTCCRVLLHKWLAIKLQKRI